MTTDLTTTAPTTMTIETVAGSYADTNAVNARLEYAAKHCNLVTPAPVCGTLPLGYEVAMSVVHLDKEDGYPVSGGLAPSRVALDKIATALGIDWDVDRSKRLDDGSDPRYCHWRAVGTVRGFDNTSQTFPGNKEMDLREGSDQALQLKPGELKMQRKFIMAHAETKARLRAIRSLGVAGSYPPEKFKKPFVVAKLMFTGRVPGNPALEAEFAKMQAAKSLGLYGAESAPPAPPALGVAAVSVPAGQAPTAPPALHAPPPRKIIDAPPPSPAGRTNRQGSPPQTAAGASPASSGYTIPGGRNEDQPIEEAATEDLEYWSGRIQGKLDAGTTPSNFVAKDTAIAEAMRAEMERRR